MEQLRVSVQVHGRAAADENRPIPPAECLCEDENFCFPGLDKKGAVRWGRRFDCGLLGALRTARLTDEEAARTPLDAVRIDASDRWDPVFVTATSSNHFAELRPLIRLLHAHYPKSRIVVRRHRPGVEEAKAWCNVEVRTFHFGRYPPHVKNLRTYAFKLAIVVMHKTFFYLDTSVRHTGRHLVELLRGVQSGHLPPFSTHTARTHHSVFASTHPGMFAYLPLPPLVSRLMEMESSVQFVSDAPYTRYVFKWWLLCAMTRECIAPKGAQHYCRIREPKNKHRTYMKCHRFDQHTPVGNRQTHEFS
ncbi:hypothetical protein M3Y99_01081400 [Aphelenchoides fujianensis]|nr:hypothetical protein M3Y99_01081400 [Aphelenchoides fujianensis]